MNDNAASQLVETLSVFAERMKAHIDRLVEFHENGQQHVLGEMKGCVEALKEQVDRLEALSHKPPCKELVDVRASIRTTWLLLVAMVGIVGYVLRILV